MPSLIITHVHIRGFLLSNGIKKSLSEICFLNDNTKTINNVVQ